MLKKCRTRGCNNTFEQYNTLQTVCYTCLIERGRKQRERDERRVHRKAKERVKSRSDWMRETQSAFNAYIRARDARDGCISCDKPATWSGQWHASHYRPAGVCTALRFHEWNVHKSCSICNNHKSGNLIEYRARLIEKVGLDAVEWLESQNKTHKWDVDDLREIRAMYRKKLKELNNE